MDEKIIIKSEHYTGKKLSKILLIVGIVLSVLFFAFFAIRSISGSIHEYNVTEETYTEHTARGYCWESDKRDTCYTCEQYSPTMSVGEYVKKDIASIPVYYQNIFCFSIIILCIFVLLALLIPYYLRCFEMTISDKRIFGKVVFGRRVDLPLDSVTAVGMGAFKSITVSTSSGRISFAAVKNCEEIHKTISDLIIERQKKSVHTETVATPATTDELKKYKELLEDGVITQEEFDAKKKQLLGL